jgi:glycine reductase
LAVITKEGGGHPQVDMAMCSDALSDVGIKSAMIIVELMATSSSSQESVLFNTPTANAIVSGGKFEYLHVPAPERVIGNIELTSAEKDMGQAMVVSNRTIRGSLSQIGGSYVRSVTY